MMVAEVIIPKKKSRAHIKCKSCGLKYSQRDYRILLDNKKLAYFNLKEAYHNVELKNADCICHDCFFRILKLVSKHTDLDKVKIKLYYQGKEQYYNYDPENPSGLW